MGNMLRYGVLISALFVFSGAIIYLVQHGHEKPQYHLFSGEPFRFINLRQILKMCCKRPRKINHSIGVTFINCHTYSKNCFFHYRVHN